MKHANIEIRPHSRSLTVQRVLHLETLGLRHAIDVGASRGQTGLSLRAAGYDGAIWSFEPLPDSFETLSALASRDPSWHVFRLGLGASNSLSTLNISSNLVSSSVLPISTSHVKAAPGSGTVGEAVVECRTLDSLVRSNTLPDEPSFLKLDVQGYELQVLRGAGSSLKYGVELIEVEMSLVELYEGQPLVLEVWGFLEEAGFEPILLEDEFFDVENNRLLQVNALFRRIRS